MKHATHLTKTSRRRAALRRSAQTRSTRGPLIFSDGFASGTSFGGLHWSAIVP